MRRSPVIRWLLEPVWTAEPMPPEEWPCPACGRSVSRDNPAQKGVWFAPVEVELRARCARQHGAHDRHGTPLPTPSDEADVASTVPVVRLAAGGFVALVPPAGVRFDPDHDGGWLAYRLDRLDPSDLLGEGVAPRGRLVGRVVIRDTEVGDDGVAATVLERLGVSPAA